MAILGTLIDKSVGNVLTGVTLTTIPHSLGQAPDEVRLQLRSVNSATAPGALFANGGSAALLTVGLQGASVALGSNLAYFDAFAQVYHSLIR